MARSRFPDLLPQLLQIAREGGFTRIGELAARAANPNCAACACQDRSHPCRLSALRNLLEAAGLRGRQLARRVAHLLRKVRQIVAHLLAIVDHLVDFLRALEVSAALAAGLRGVLLRDQIAHMVRLLLLLGCQLIRRLRHGVDAARGVLLLRPTEQVGSFAQAVGRAAGIGRTGVLRSRAPHIVIGLTQAIERLLRRLLAAVSGLIRSLLRIAGAAFIPLFDWPLALIRPEELPPLGRRCLPDCPCWPLWPLLPKLLLHLPLELLPPRAATSPAAIFARRSAAAVALLLRQILFALRQLVELLQRVVDFLLLSVRRCCG